ncbi:MAG: choice-of-anchor Q domain-containing protein [Flavisolibacter sp.]
MKLFGKLAALVCFVIFFSCTKESFTSDPSYRLTTSVDTLHFDTVFTTTGSFSQFIKIFNNNPQGIRLSSIKLAGGTASAFRINADGIAGPQVNDVEIAANDSAYIYVTVTINPNAEALPFVVRDSIEITYNGNNEWVQLEAWGQNAHFFRNKVISGNEVWTNDLPYVILGPLNIKEDARLSIEKGCRIFLHADAPFVVDGTLRVNGEKDSADRVIFTGDRLDAPYSGFPASYPGLIFTEKSKDNVLNYAIIKNAYQGVVVAGLTPSGTKLTLNQVAIENAWEQGIWAVNTSIDATNLLVSNCGQNLLLFGGGDYNFRHCTSVSYSNAYIPHKKPVLTVLDYYVQNNVATVFPLQAVFTNCIFWGEENGFADNEVVVDKKGSATPKVVFDHVLWRVKEAPSSVFTSVVGNPLNTDPLFDSVNTSRRFFDFRLNKKNSPAVDAGVEAGVSLDLQGLPRPQGLKPDLGAYEKQ